MTFKEMPYERPDIEALKTRLTALTEQLSSAADYAAAKLAFLEMEKLNKHIQTQAVLCSVRHSIDTRDEALLCVNEVSAQYKWDENSMAVQSFYKVFDKKF